jgi:multicomponent Na+:H+ antiporter subunit C
VNPVALYLAVGLAVFCAGFYGILSRPQVLRKALALNFMSSGVFLFLVALGRRAGEGPVDPVPHALVLTGIVVAVSATALLLVLTCRYYEVTGREVLRRIVREEETEP